MENTQSVNYKFIKKIDTLNKTELLKIANIVGFLQYEPNSIEDLAVIVCNFLCLDPEKHGKKIFHIFASDLEFLRYENSQMIVEDDFFVYKLSSGSFGAKTISSEFNYSYYQILEEKKKISLKSKFKRLESKLKNAKFRVEDIVDRMQTYQSNSKQYRKWEQKKKNAIDLRDILRDYIAYLQRIDKRLCTREDYRSFFNLYSKYSKKEIFLMINR